MRIIYEPIAFDWPLLPNNNEGSSSPMLFFLDRRKLNITGVREAVRYCDSKSVSQGLVEFAAHEQRWLIGLAKYVGMTGSVNDSPEFRQSLIQHIQQLIEKYKKTILENPQVLLKQAKATLASEDVDHKNECFDEERSKALQWAQQAMEALPDYLKTIRREPVTIAVAEGPRVLGSQMTSHGSSDHAENMICLTHLAAFDLHEENGLDVLKEEVLHYFDGKLGLSAGTNFRAAAEKVFCNEFRMMGIENMANQIHQKNYFLKSPTGKTFRDGYTKISIRDYHPSKWYDELVVEYFFIRDELRKRMGKIENADEGHKEGFINETMKSLFGEELVMLCQEFEQAIQERGAAAAKSERGRKSGGPRR